MRTRVLLMLGALLALLAGGFTSALAATEKRVALVIGNSAYRHAVPLANPERDAKAVAAKLRKLGFVVVEGYDLDHNGMEDAVKDFSKAVRGAALGMFFYAGHGMQVNGKNYFVPVDAAFEEASALDFEAIPMDLITRQMQNDVAVRLVVLDACRDNPLSRSLSRSMGGGTRSNAVSEGLAKVDFSDAGEGTAIIFATSPDEVALDGDGDHSPFTKALLNNMETPDTDLQVVMSRVTGEVFASTKQQQRPWINASLTGEVFLNPNRTPAVAAAPASAAAPAVQPQANAGNSLERETILYNLARESGQREDYQAYLEVFPDGLYAVNARKQIERMDAAQEQKAVASLETVPPAQPAPADPARSVPAPALELPITDAVRAMPADAATEAALNLNKEKRAEVQTRLNLAGFQTGSPDGSFGGKTRIALQAWQSGRGLNPSGFLNQPQYEILVQQTQAALAAYVPPVAPPVRSLASPPPVKRAAVKPEKTRRTVRKEQTRRAGNRDVVVRRVQRPSRGGARSEEIGRFMGGVLGGMISR